MTDLQALALEWRKKAALYDSNGVYVEQHKCTEESIRLLLCANELDALIDRSARVVPIEKLEELRKLHVELATGGMPAFAQGQLLPNLWRGLHLSFASKLAVLISEASK